MYYLTLFLPLCSFCAAVACLPYLCRMLLQHGQYAPSHMIRTSQHSHLFDPFAKRLFVLYLSHFCLHFKYLMCAISQAGKRMRPGVWPALTSWIAWWQACAFVLPLRDSYRNCRSYHGSPRTYAMRPFDPCRRIRLCMQPPLPCSTFPSPGVDLILVFA